MNSSRPAIPGGQMPDIRPPASYTQVPSTNIVKTYGDSTVTVDPFGQVPITAPTYTDYAQKNHFEKLIRYVNLSVETLEGWQLVAAPVEQGKMNQPVQLVHYPRKPLPQVPENVPPPVWTHTEESFNTQMDRYSAQFQIPGDFSTFGEEAAAEMYANYSASLISGAVISLKHKITAAFMQAKQNQWVKNLKRDTTRGMIDVTEMERESYVSLSRRTKGWPNMVNFARALARQEAFDFDMCVLPYGTLDKIASNNYFSEFFRSGENAIQNVLAGGKRLKNMIDGMTMWEDAKWSVHGNGKLEEEPFVHSTTRGGWCYNKGSVDCDDEDDPNCKFGFAYICKGHKNWCTKSLLDLIRESGRFTADGTLDPHHFTLAQQWENLCRSCKLQPVEGRLDPMLYRIDSAVVNSGAHTRYVVARRFGEVDIRYSPLDKLRRHAERMKTYVKTKMDAIELSALSKLESHKKTLTSVGTPSESQEAFVAAVVILNSPDDNIFNIAPGTNFSGFDVNLSNLGIFVEQDVFTKAPKVIPTVKKLSDIQFPDGAGSVNAAAFEAAVRAQIFGGVDKVITFVKEGVEHIMVAIPLDTFGGAGHQRGEVGAVYEYVAVPLVRGNILDNAKWGAFAAQANALLRFEDLHGSGVNNAANLGQNVVNHDNTSWVSRETYNTKASKGTLATLRWVYRPTTDIQQAIAQVGGRGIQDTHYGGTAPGQGFRIPRVVQAPDLPYFYGGINGLRYLAELKRNGDPKGWDAQLLSDAHLGVQALDKLIQIAMEVYTDFNMYFDPTLVPLHLKTEDPEINRLNTAICGLWGEFQRPFLARRPYRLKSAMGNWAMPRSFSDAEDDSSSPKGWIRGVLGIYNNQWVPISGGNLANQTVADAHTAYGAFANAGTTLAQRRAFAVSATVASLIDSGVLHGNVREVLTNPTKWAEFTQDYENGPASLTYAQYLKSSAPLTNVAAVPTYRPFAVFFQRELVGFLNDAVQSLLEGLVAVTNPGGVAPAVGVPFPQDRLANVVRNIYAFANVLSGLVLLWLDSKAMNYTVNAQWLRSKKAAALDPNAAGPAGARGVGEKRLITEFITSSVNSARQVAGAAAGATAAVAANTTQYWINTSLMVDSGIWRRLDSELKSAVAAFRAARSPATAARLATVYNLPMRPMMGADHGKPIAGEPITEKTFGVDLVARPDAGAAHISTIASSLSQAMVRGRNSEFDRRDPSNPSFLRNERLRTHVRDAEDIARGLSASHFEADSRRINVPVEFVTRDPNSISNAGQPVDAYMVPVQLDGTGGVIDGQVEPQWLKYRLNDIETFYKNDTLGRMFAHLYCFSPIHFKVIENMINKKITPFGTGFVMLRPFQNDLTGAALFTVSGPSTAKSRFDATLSTAGYNQQYNHFNVIFAARLGATVIQQNRVLWMNAQTMHGNVRGMGGSMYIEKDSFDLNRAMRPDRDGFVVFVGDNLKMEEIPACVSITSQYNIDKYGSQVNNRSVLQTNEQHLPGLIFLITKHRLNELNAGQYNVRNSYWEEKFGAFVNTDCYSEDHAHWNHATKSYSNVVKGNWHLSGLTPEDSDFLNGTGLMRGSESTIVNFKG